MYRVHRHHVAYYLMRYLRYVGTLGRYPFSPCLVVWLRALDHRVDPAGACHDTDGNARPSLSGRFFVLVQPQSTYRGFSLTQAPHSRSFAAAGHCCFSQPRNDMGLPGYQNASLSRLSHGRSGLYASVRPLQDPRAPEADSTRADNTRREANTELLT